MNKEVLMARAFTCKDCGNDGEHTGTRGRIPVRCDGCKKQRVAARWAAWKAKKAEVTA